VLLQANQTVLLPRCQLFFQTPCWLTSSQSGQQQQRQQQHSQPTAAAAAAHRLMPQQLLLLPLVRMVAVLQHCSTHARACAGNL
jgi:hypothetical protein